MIQSSRPEGLLADASDLRRFFAAIAARHAITELTFLCIGTDRSTGDSLGPWVGTMLKDGGFPRVIGTLEQPCDADRLPEVIAGLAPGEPVVAIDACLGRPGNVGRFVVSEGPLQPAKSVGKAFAPVGAYSVAAIVNAYGPKPYWTLQTTSLYHVLRMARHIGDAIAAEWPRPI